MCCLKCTRASELFIGKSLVITSQPTTTPDTVIYSHLRVRLSSRFPVAVIYVTGCLFELIECLRKRNPSSFLLLSRFNNIINVCEFSLSFNAVFTCLFTQSRCFLNVLRGKPESRKSIVINQTSFHAPGGKRKNIKLKPM